ncbi:hypothetical protein F8O06_03225 [Pseudoclavibacter sp. CFCC 14310]|uniref:ComF family protein n=1 Tax=Pseudoclavibacter sp. CFCC 14310 TaxID=2615180 RepID=UPI001300F1F6|nr:phosphoribosyltransferase family protein [Pseudoclavibacter sp. CFCC 14310]KAB1647565.1 hypothetical protein F8O06_03225 [Pseudoclavibacter sp. CFCC 14310]
MDVMGALREIGTLLLPETCLACGGRTSTALCITCLQAFDDSPTAVCVDGVPCLGWDDHDGRIRVVIRAVKDDRRTAELGLLRMHANRLAAVARRRLASDGAVWAALPSSAAARRRRGFCLAERAFGRSGESVREDVLWPVRKLHDQRALSASGRRSNLADALYADRGVVDGRQVLLIDDVMTTGATMRAARDAVLASGGDVVGMLVLARTPRALAAR